jgi:hypothetical protein
MHGRALARLPWPGSGAVFQGINTRGGKPTGKPILDNRIAQIGI